MGKLPPFGAGVDIVRNSCEKVEKMPRRQIRTLMVLASLRALSTVSNIDDIELCSSTVVVIRNRKQLG